MARDPGIVRFNKVCILQSLDEAERQTGDEIYSLIKYTSLKYPIFYTLVHLDSSRDLFSALQNIKLQTTQEKVIPYIHFEIHGTKEGFQMNNNDVVRWEQLKHPLLEINKLTGNNLFVSLATCFGAYLFKILNLREPCPFYGYICPDHEVGNVKVEADFSIFFETLLVEKSFDRAIETLLYSTPDRSPNYSYLNCYGLFDMMAEKYRSKNRNRGRVVNNLISSYRTHHPTSKLTVNQVRSKVKYPLRNGWEKKELETMKKYFTHEISANPF